MGRAGRRVGYRYRSELAPFAVAAALLLAAAILHHNQVPAWLVPLVTVPLAGGLCWPRVAPLLRPIERGYAVAITVLSGGWLALAVALGPDTPRLSLILLDPTLQHKNRADVLIDGPEIVVRPVRTR